MRRLVSSPITGLTMRTRLRGARLPVWAVILTTLAIGVLAVAPIVRALGPSQINLGTAAPFAVLAGSTVTSTGATVITGNLGLSPGTSVTGFPPGTVSGTIYPVTDAVAVQAKADLDTAYAEALALTADQTLDLTAGSGRSDPRWWRLHLRRSHPESRWHADP